MKQVQKAIVRKIIQTLSDRGIRVMVTGGAVRDAMLAREPQDIDLSADASAQTLCEIFYNQGARQVGGTYPICLVNGIEISPAPEGDLDFPLSDLGRRDFTFNSMACDPYDRKILDPFNGRQDLKERVIRFTNSPLERINEDPVRMVRACRFAAMIDGEIEKNSFEAIHAQSVLLKNRVAAERIRLEICKAMLLEKPSLFFIWLQRCGLLQWIFPSLSRCVTLDGGPYHGETVFEHCLLVGDALPPDNPMLRLAGFLHDVGKYDAAFEKEGRLSFAGHENHFQKMETDLEQLRFSNKEIAYVRGLTRAHMRPLTDQSTPKAVRRLLVMLKGYGLDYQDFMRMRIADRRGNKAKPPYTITQLKDRLALLYKEISSDAVSCMADLHISGSRIAGIKGISPGPEIGRIKSALFEHVLDHPEDNTPDKLEALCHFLKIEN